MSLIIFVDALPYTEIILNYPSWFDGMQISKLQPNIGYSSTLHWQLFANKYPDEKGTFVDWCKEEEPRKSVKFFSTILTPFDFFDFFSCLIKKFLDRKVYRANIFANIPFKFRKYFSNKGKYLFWEKETYSGEQFMDGYTMVSQDEGHRSFEVTMKSLNEVIDSGTTQIFTVLGFADAEGHRCARGEKYSANLRSYMSQLHNAIEQYLLLHSSEDVLIVSDHGMSTVKNMVNLELETKFGKPSVNNYITYSDTAIMCIWCKDDSQKKYMEEYLLTRTEGHLITDEERKYYGVTNKKFGDIIFNLREGNIFANNWFGKSLKKPSPDGFGMHGFWPAREALDQMACILLINGKRSLDALYDYRSANRFISDVMQQER